MSMYDSRKVQGTPNVEDVSSLVLPKTGEKIEPEVAQTLARQVADLERRVSKVYGNSEVISLANELKLA